MSKLKKVLTIVLAQAIFASSLIAGTVAFLTDRDSEANIFTVGDVAIDLTEDFDEDDAVLIPGVEIGKKAAVKNTGKNDAWVWATVAYPKVLDPVVLFTADKTGAWTLLNTATAEKDGVDYTLVTYLHDEAVEPEETTVPFLFNVAMDTRVDIDPDGDWYIVERGNATAVGWNTGTDGKPVVQVSAYAIQTEGFDDVQAGYDAYLAQWADNGTAWDKVTVNPAYTEVATLADMQAALDKGENVKLTEDISFKNEQIMFPDNTPVVIDLNGKTIEKTGEYYVMIIEANDDVTITDSVGTGTFIKTSGFYFFMNEGKLKFEACTINRPNSDNLVYAKGDAVTEITGGNFIIKNIIARQSDSSTAVISGGNFTIETIATGLWNSGTTVTGGTFSSSTQNLSMFVNPSTHKIEGTGPYTVSAK